MGEFAFPKLHVRPWWILSDDPLAPNVGDGGGGVGGDGEMLFAVEARGARSEEEEEEVIASSCGVQISSRSLKCS